MDVSSQINQGKSLLNKSYDTVDKEALRQYLITILRLEPPATAFPNPGTMKRFTKAVFELLREEQYEGMPFQDETVSMVRHTYTLNVAGGRNERADLRLRAHFYAHAATLAHWLIPALETVQRRERKRLAQEAEAHLQQAYELSEEKVDAYDSHTMLFRLATMNKNLAYSVLEREKDVKAFKIYLEKTAVFTLDSAHFLESNLGSIMADVEEPGFYIDNTIGLLVETNTLVSRAIPLLSEADTRHDLNSIWRLSYFLSYSVLCYARLEAVPHVFSGFDYSVNLRRMNHLFRTYGREFQKFVEIIKESATDKHNMFPRLMAPIKSPLRVYILYLSNFLKVSPQQLDYYVPHTMKFYKTIGGGFPKSKKRRKR